MPHSVRQCASRLLLSSLLPAVAFAQQDRILAPIIYRTPAVVLTGNVHPLARQEFDLGPVEPSFQIRRITLMLRPSADQQRALDDLLVEQQNRLSSNYHLWLTPEQYADRFGLSTSDIAKIAGWLQSEGFTIEDLARARNWIAFSGTVGQLRTAFGVEIHRYRVDGELHFANATPPAIPADLAPLTFGILGVDDFHPRPQRVRRKIRANPESNLGLFHYLAPDDLATIYDLNPLYNLGYDGKGQTIVVAGQSDVDLSEISAYRTLFGLPSGVPLPKLVLVGPDPGVTDALDEADLDLELAGAIAREANLIYVYANNVFSAVQYAIDNNLAPIISFSFGACEAQAGGSLASLEATAQQANAEGITWIASSGDSGPAACDPHGDASHPVATSGISVSVPADIPEVTGVGGTTFNEGAGNYWSASNGVDFGSALQYIPETTWNDTAADGFLSASGGGASAFFPKPLWQTGSGVPNDGARDVPDVALAASADHDGYLFCFNGDCNNNLIDVAGGTSAATPAFAGMLAVLQQFLIHQGLQTAPGLGNINPTLYQLARNPPVANIFHDITSGNNFVPCQLATLNCTTGRYGFSAASGYDLVTGLGSLDAANFVEAWSIAETPPPPRINSFTVNPSSISPGQSATLAWSISGSGVTVTIDNGVGNVSNVTSTIIAPFQTTTYTLTATNSAGSTAARVSVTLANSGALDLALNKAATQSSTYAPGFTDASKAVDGNTDGRYADGSLTHTNLDANAWWQVDLGASAAISSIVVWNRTDCCSGRLSDYWVFVSNSPFQSTDSPITLQNRAGTWSSHQTTQPSPSSTIAVPGAQGRYVRVQLSGSNYLSLAEVHIFGTLVGPAQDLALNQPTTQSSTYAAGLTMASKAVDGNTDGVYADGSLTHTNLDANAWWQVDLGASAAISSIVVWNRTDCCGSRLSDYWVFVSNTPFLATDTPATLQNRAGTFSSHQTTQPNPSATIAISGAQGRYIRVQLSGANYLSLAEVQVFGTLQSPVAQNLAVSKAATQSSSYAPGFTDAAKAVDGNTDGVYADGSLTHTDLDTNAWWQVDLGTAATVSSIVVWNRTDCCGSRLSDYWVFVSNTPFLPTDTPTTLQNRAGTWSSHQTTQPSPSATIAVPGTQGRYVRVQLSGANYLSLAEVQVFGQ